MKEKKKPRIANLKRVDGVLLEMGRVYRQARLGEIETIEGKRLTEMLLAMRTTIETTALELRVKDLEGKP